MFLFITQEITIPSAKVQPIISDDLMTISSISFSTLAYVAL